MAGSTLGRAALLAAAGAAALAQGDERPVPARVRHPEGLVHGYLKLSTLSGELLAAGDLLQNVRGDEVTSRLVFRFKDGSSSDETAVFRQRRHFQLLRYRLRQSGPAFPRPLELSVDAKRGEATVRYTDDDGQPKVEHERLAAPADLANGLVPVLLKNRATEDGATMSFVAATPKPRVVELKAKSAGEEPFQVAGTTRQAVHYVIEVEIGGLAGVLAPLVGKQPPDTHVWIQAGEAPGFLSSEGPLYMGGPAWRIELTSPRWERATAENERPSSGQ